MVQAWLLGTDSRVSVRLAVGSEEEAGPPKLLSLREETPELALPDRLELLPSRMDCGLVGEAGIGCRGDWRERRGRVTQTFTKTESVINSCGFIKYV